jgi:hypothetical protein
MTFNYRRTLLTYCDLLGFRALVSSGNAAERIGKTLLAFQRYSAPLGQNVKAEFATFSDLIVRSVPFGFATPQDRIRALVGELQDMIFAQTEVLKYDVFVRGAIAVGDMCVTDKVLFGPALLDAYDAERCIARFPRVIINPDLCEDFRTELANPSDPYTRRLKELVAIDEDGVTYVNYLCGRSTTYRDECEYIDLLFLHRRAIQELRNAYLSSPTPSIEEKLTWLVTYHNHALNELSDTRLQAFSVRRDVLAI